MLLSLDNIRLAEKERAGWLFDQLCLEVNAGEGIAILGTEGCGKSTLLRLLAGLLPPHGGSIRLWDRPLAEWRDQERVRHLGVWFQDPSHMLLMPTIRDELALAPLAQGVGEPELSRRLKAAMELTGIPALPMERDPATLPISWQSRIALAAVLTAEPSLLLADEPGIFLSDEGEMALGASLERWRQQTGAASVILTSRRTRARRFGEIFWRLEHGRLERLPDPS